MSLPIIPVIQLLGFLCFFLRVLGQFGPEYSLEGLMLKLKLQYFGRLMQRTDSLEKTLMLRKIEGRRRGRQKMRWMRCTQLMMCVII